MNKFSQLSLLWIALPIAFLSGCATNAMTGRSQLMLVSEQSAIAQSGSAYTSLIGSLEKKGKISQDEALVKRIQNITDRLISQAVRYRPDTREWAWSVKVIDDPKTVNAFCMAGGKMAIYTGLIEKMQASDDEIAQVMGHEIAHALANHSAEKMSVQMASSIAVVAITATGRSNSDRQVRQDVASLGALGLINLPNSREAETEADKLGIEIAARAGYDPRAAVTLWQKMAKENGDDSRFDLLSTHPAPPNRIDALAALEPAMQHIYAAVPKDQAAPRAWTALAPNERIVSANEKPVVAGNSTAATDQTEAPLMFYSASFEQFKAGETELTCRAECAMVFAVKQGTLKAHHDKGDWQALAVETLKAGYRIDLAYYYLGKAAQGLGFHAAARKYLEAAHTLAATKDQSCAAGFFIGCSGIDVQALSKLSSAP